MLGSATGPIDIEHCTTLRPSPSAGLLALP